MFGLCDVLFRHTKGHTDKDDGPESLGGRDCNAVSDVSDGSRGFDEQLTFQHQSPEAALPTQMADVTSATNRVAAQSQSFPWTASAAASNTSIAQFNANQPDMSFDRNWSSRSPLAGSSQNTIGLLEPGNHPHSNGQNGLQKEQVDPRQPPSDSAAYFNPAEASNGTGQMLWQDVVYYPMENLFSNGSASKLDPREGSSWGLDADCQRRLEAAFVTDSVDLQGPNLTTTLPNSHFVPSGMKFPPAPILDIALGLFFRRLHPSLPFIHVPTFCVQTTPVSFLLVICLNGLSILGTTGATEFVARMFPVILQRTFTQLASFSVGPASTWEQLTTISTAMLTVNLAATMGNASYIAQCQMLYTALLAVAQRHGLFLSAKDCVVHDQLAAMTEPEAQWKAWSRVESLKRMICCLPIIDSWYASHLCDSPIIRSEKIQIFVPSDGALFQAKSASEWGQISREKGVSVSSISSGRLELNSDSFGASTVLAIAQNRILELYQQIIRDGYPTSQLVPWREYKHESRVNDILKITLIGTHQSAPDLPRLDINCMIWWHSLCIMLLANTQIFDLAAGRHGPDPASDALDRIARWTATPDARRACVHAAQNYKLMSSRRVSEIITMHSVSALFVSALVLGLYIFMVPTNLNDPAVELTNIDVDWEDLESLELFEENSMSSTDQTTRQQATDPPASSVQNFVRNGGIISLFGIPHPGGYESARRVLLDFSTLMDGTGERKSRIFSQILHIMCDDLMSVDQVK
ncbi:MAG: hypothetical protein Q9160_007043 [Pyrenula sp. 1 TL-2023]